MSIFFIKSFNGGYQKLLIVTGKGLRSKSYQNPYLSEKFSVLKYSVPEYIQNNDRESIYELITNKNIENQILERITNKTKDMKISKPLPELDLRKYQKGGQWKRRSTDKKITDK